MFTHTRAWGVVGFMANGSVLMRTQDPGELGKESKAGPSREGCTGR